MFLSEIDRSPEITEVITKIPEAPASCTSNDTAAGARDASSRDRLVLENLSLVELATRRMLAKLPASVDAEDLRSEAVMGLIEAANRFDESRGIRFRTFAEHRVQGAMLDYLRSINWAPRPLHQKAKAIEQARCEIESRTFQNATAAEIAEELGVSIKQCHQMLMQARSINMSEMEYPFAETDQGQFDAVSNRRADDPSFNLERKEMLDLVSEAIESLPERQKVLLWLYYVEELTLREAGAVLNINEARASQIHSKAIATVRREAGCRLSFQKPDAE